MLQLHESGGALCSNTHPVLFNGMS